MSHKGPLRALQFVLSTLAAIGTASCAHGGTVRPDDPLACLAGTYDGGQMEVAAGLALGSDRRFAYGLSYGALDESSEGRWEADAGQVYLTSDPVKAPAFIFLGERASPDSLYHIELDLPEGFSRQYFDARIKLAEGTFMDRQFEEEGLEFEVPEGMRPVSVTLSLPVFGIESAPQRLTGNGPSELHVRFDPNDLGKVAFAHTPLRRTADRLELERHGLQLRFRPVKGGCAATQAD